MSAEPATADTLRQARLALPIKGRAPKTGYDRSLFGDAWTDDVTVADGHNGCDTRNDILRRDLVDVVIKPGSNGCAVLERSAQRPLHRHHRSTFERGPGTSAQVQIDHVVALSDAWQKGAQEWDEFTRRNFANDPRNLQATLGWVNQQKGDGGRGDLAAAQRRLPMHLRHRGSSTSRPATGCGSPRPSTTRIARVLCRLRALAATPAGWAGLSGACRAARRRCSIRL